MVRVVVVAGVVREEDVGRVIGDDAAVNARHDDGGRVGRDRVVGGRDDHRAVGDRIGIGDGADLDAAWAPGEFGGGPRQVLAVDGEGVVHRAARQHPHVGGDRGDEARGGDAVHPVVHGRIGDGGAGLGEEIELVDSDGFGAVVGVGDGEGQIVADLEHGFGDVGDGEGVGGIITRGRCGRCGHCGHKHGGHEYGGHEHRGDARRAGANRGHA